MEVNLVENCFNFVKCHHEYLSTFQWKRLDRKRGNNVKVNPGLTESIDCVETNVDNTSVDLNQLFHIL